MHGGRASSAAVACPGPNDRRRRHDPVTLAVRPPIAPMLARLVRELPVGAFTYEPKWDGFRCIAFADVDAIDLRSRHERPMGRYFPELVGAFRELVERIRLLGGEGAAGLVLDGEILLDRPESESRDGPEGERPDDPRADLADFAILMSRLHPAASRVERLSRAWPARYVAFDLLAEGETDLRAHPFLERRGRLESIIPAGTSRITVTPATRDPDVARRWLDARTAGIDGVVAKADELPYAAGRRSMIKVKTLRTADCVVAGVRTNEEGLVGTLLLGLYAPNDELRHVGVVTQLSRSDRLDLAEDLVSRTIPLEAHPWRNGFSIGASPLGRLPGSAARWTPDMEHDWIPIRPERVVEVGFDQVDGDRFRHPARFLRSRPDRDARSCRLDQITAAIGQPFDDPDGRPTVSG
jgi:ATP-dependent DNA ligase